MRELGHVGHHRSLKNYSDVGEEFKYSDPLTDLFLWEPLTDTEKYLWALKCAGIRSGNKKYHIC